MHLPRTTTADGLFEWLLIAIIGVALLAALVLFVSWIGWLPPIDRIDGAGAVIAP